MDFQVRSIWIKVKIDCLNLDIGLPDCKSSNPRGEQAKNFPNFWVSCEGFLLSSLLTWSIFHGRERMY